MKHNLLYRMLAAICGIAILTAAAFAQPAAAPTPGPVKGCTTTTVYVHGQMDNFGGGPDPTTPSPALAAFLAPLHPATYDVGQPNYNFGDSFQICGCKTCGGTLEIGVRKTNPVDIPLNDGITVGVAPFTGPRVVSQLVWAANDPPSKTLTINLDPAKLNEVLCAQRTSTPWLDVYIQDDTVVDYIKLTILHP